MNAEILKIIKTLSKHEVNFMLGLISTFNYPISIPNSTQYLISCLETYFTDDNQIQHLLNFTSLKKVTDSLFNAIESDLRYAIWFDCLYRYYNDYSIPKSFITFSVNFIEALITNINCSTFSNTNHFPPGYAPYEYHNYAVENKRSYLIGSLNSYQLIKTENRKLSWLDKNDEEQLAWAVEYLLKAKILYTPHLFMPKSNEEVYFQICASLDIMDIPVILQPINIYVNPQNLSSATKLLFINKMKKAWSQKKFRRNKDFESAQDILLSKQSKKQLRKISHANNVSSVEMLEYLILQEYEQIRK